LIQYIINSECILCMHLLKVTKNSVKEWEIKKKETL
jgi:hypothetical protein